MLTELSNDDYLANDKILWMQNTNTWQFYNADQKPKDPRREHKGWLSSPHWRGLLSEVTVVVIENGHICPIWNKYIAMRALSQNRLHCVFIVPLNSLVSFLFWKQNNQWDVATAEGEWTCADWEPRAANNGILTEFQLSGASESRPEVQIEQWSKVGQLHNTKAQKVFQFCF